MSAPSPRREEEPSAAIGAANVVLRHRRLILWTVIVLTSLMVGLALLKPRTYTSTTSFMPQVTSGSLAGLSSMAAQFGVNVATEDPTQSPDFYAEVIRSRDLLTSLATASYEVRTPDGIVRGPVAEVIDVEAPDPETRLEKAIRKLEQMIFTKITRQTGILHVTVRTPYPDLSQRIAEHLLVQLDEFNAKLRQNRASAEEKFLEQREQEARVAQDAAERRLVDFLQRNRNYGSAPALTHEYQRLTREAAYRSDVVSTLTQGSAQARLEAARNTPVITVLDRPNRALRPDPRGLARTGVLGIVLGTVIGIVLALTADAFRRRSNEDELHAFERLRAELRHDLGRPWRLLFGRSRSAQPEGFA